MDGAELDKLSLPEYIRYIHGLPWEEFITEAFRKSGTFYVSTLYEKALEIKAKAIVELGMMIGQSTHALLKVAMENGGHLYSIETNRDSLPLVGEALKSGGLDTSFWTAIHGDDLEVVKTWVKPIDLLFVDTLHTYEQTLNELKAYSKFIVEHGIIILHDTYVEPSRLVKKAIDDWMNLNRDWTYEDITPHNDGWGLGLLKRR